MGWGGRAGLCVARLRSLRAPGAVVAVAVAVVAAELHLRQSSAFRLLRSRFLRARSLLCLMQTAIPLLQLQRWKILARS